MSGWHQRATGVHFDDAAQLVALVPMKPSAAHLLWHLIAMLDTTEWRHITHERLADTVGLERATVTKALSTLEERGIIARRRRDKHMRLTLFLCWKGTVKAYQEQVRARHREIVDATGWHTSRAIANLDSEDVRDLIEWCNDPEGAERAGIVLAERPEADEGQQRATYGPEGPRPEYIGDEDWQRVLYRFPDMHGEMWSLIRRALADRYIDEDIHDWVDDFAMKYWGDPQAVEDAIRNGWYRARPGWNGQFDFEAEEDEEF